MAGSRTKSLAKSIGGSLYGPWVGLALIALATIVVGALILGTGLARGRQTDPSRPVGEIGNPSSLFSAQSPKGVPANPLAASSPTPPPQSFADVPPSYWAYTYIEALYHAGFVAGCSTSPLLYCPVRNLTRAESAVFILRGKYGAIANPPYPAPATPTFADVAKSYWAYGWIESLWKDAFTAGCGTNPLVYCPLQQHTRAEGSVFFLRVKNGASYSPPSASGIFNDVPLTAWYAGWVEAAYTQGLLPACSTSPLSFCPDGPLNRAWAAYMMVQAKGGLPLPTATPAPPTSTPTAGPPTPTPMASTYFPVGLGSVDVIPHQIVRTSDDRVFIFASQQFSSVIHAYWTGSPGLPNSASAFNGSATVTASGEPISLDAAYDGGDFIFVLTNQQDGALRVYPFNTKAGAFAGSATLVSGNPSVSGYYIGSSGVSATFDHSGILQVAYWAAGNQITQAAYSVNPTTGALTPSGTGFRVDSAGAANHPFIAVAPDDSVTVAWVSQASSPVSIQTRTRSSAGVWGAVQTVSSAPVWHSLSAGVNIDQGPSLLISPNGVRRLVYIEDYTGSNYGRVHYVNNAGGTWSDTALAFWSHDPALALDTTGLLTIIGHGHPSNAACINMQDICTVKQTGPTSWAAPQVFATAPSGSSFDSSPSTKWSGVPAALVRPDVIEFVFFSTPYNSPTAYYARVP
jgi:hypothetical protein